MTSSLVLRRGFLIQCSIIKFLILCWILKTHFPVLWKYCKQDKGSVEAITGCWAKSVFLSYPCYQIYWMLSKWRSHYFKQGLQKIHYSSSFELVLLFHLLNIRNLIQDMKFKRNSYYKYQFLRQNSKTTLTC